MIDKRDRKGIKATTYLILFTNLPRTEETTLRGNLGVQNLLQLWEGNIARNISRRSGWSSSSVDKFSWHATRHGTRQDGGWSTLRFSWRVRRCYV